MVPACEDFDNAGLWGVECWGGATLDACILNEDPWEQLRTLGKLMSNSRLQMLLRWRNLLGYRHYEAAWWSGSWPNQRITAWMCSVCLTR